MNEKYLQLRSKEDADEFLEHHIDNGEKDLEKLRLPSHLGGKKVKVVLKQGKAEKKRFLVSDIESKKFYKIHPSSIEYGTYQ